MALINKSDQPVEPPIQLAQVLAEELRQIRPNAEIPRDLHLDKVFRLLHKQNLRALCFSGGGIRSATFGLGIVQSLAKNGLLEKFDYLSTVSGGGYLGSWLSAWILRERVRIGGADASGGLRAYDHIEGGSGADPVECGVTTFGTAGLDVDKVDRDIGVREVQRKINCMPLNSYSDPNPEPDQLQHLREYSNYMSPRVGLLSADTWALGAIYLRNLFLNLTIFVPLIAAILLIPRIFYSTIYWDTITSATTAVALLASMGLAAVAIAFVLYHLPSHVPRDQDPRSIDNADARTMNSDPWVVGVGVVPLLFMAIALATIWASTLTRLEALTGYKELLAHYAYLPKDLQAAFYFIVSTLLVSALGYALFSFTERYKEGFTFSWLNLVAAVLSAGLFGVLLWLVPSSIFDTDRLAAGVKEGSNYFLLYVCFSVPLFMLIYLAAGTVYVGLSSRKSTDADREWLARYGAWILIVCAVWIVLNVLVLFGPIAIERITNIDWQSWWSVLQPVVVGIIGILSGVISLFGGFSSQGLVRDEPVQSKLSRVLSVAPKVAAVVFLGFIFVGLAYATVYILRGASTMLWNMGVPEALLLSGAAESQRSLLLQSGVLFLLIALLIMAAIGIFMAFFVNVNKFSLHGAYRDRLVRAYLGASNRFRRPNQFTGFDEADNFQLHRLKRQRPFHIINATLNLVAGKQLAWQNRKAASFTMSPLHCGSSVLGYRRSNEYCRNTHLGPCERMTMCNRLNKDCGTVENCKLPGKAIRLGTAMAISGAAANPNMGYYSSSVVTFLMSLFNIRLGWWLGNTGEVGSRKDNFGRPFYSKQSPTVAVLPLLNETLGRTDEHKRYINVTDGGHFENLALYEMVLRRCRLIVLSDGAADYDFKFGEIANAIQKCKVDLGVDIKLLGTMRIASRVGSNGLISKSRFAIAEINYPEKNANGDNLKGWILYTRPTYYAKSEPRDIMNYADSNPRFPHQSTGDQMYDEKQFEAYRGLGFLTMSEIRDIFSATALGDPKDEVDDDLEALFWNNPAMRKVIFSFFGVGNWKEYKPRNSRPQAPPPWELY